LYIEVLLKMHVED